MFSTAVLVICSNLQGEDLNVQELDAFSLGLMVSDCGIKMQTQMALIPKFTLCGRPHQLLDPVQLAQGGGCSVASETTCSADSPSEDADTVFLSVIHPPSPSSEGVTGEGTGCSTPWAPRRLSGRVCLQCRSCGFEF